MSDMKRRLITCLLATMMALSFAVSAVAADAVSKDPVYVACGQEITPLNEQTRIYVRYTANGWQFRVWSITNGRWITDWLYI